MSRARYKFDIYAAGQISTTGTISWTFTENRFPTNFAPTVGGQIARPTQGIVESQPWVMSILDVASSFTGLLANSSGRLQQLGRLARMRRSLDSTASTAYQTIAAGRIFEVALNPAIASYDLTVLGENWLAQQTEVFTKVDNSLSIVPGGYIKNAPAFMIDYPDGKYLWQCAVKYGRTTLLRVVDAMPKGGMTGAVGAVIAEDVKPGYSVYPFATTATIAALTTGNFKHLRWRGIATSADYGIAAFGFRLIVVGHGLAPGYPDLIYAAAQNGWSSTDPQMNNVWVVWNSTAAAPAVLTKLQGYIHAAGTYVGSGVAHDAGLPPSPAMPVLVGGVAGLHPADIVKNAYNGVYSPTTATQQIRYSTAAMAKWKQQSLYGALWCRITQPLNMQDWLTQTLYQPYGMIPTLDSSGKIAPKSILLPTSNDIGSTMTLLPRLTSTNLVEHPTWGSQSRELVNVLDMRVRRIVRVYVEGSIEHPRTVLGARIMGPFASADKLGISTGSQIRTHDNTTLLGRHVQTLTFGDPSGPVNSSAPFAGDIQAFTSALSRSYFARFGNGPIYSDLVALPSIDQTTWGRLVVGNYVAMKLATYPNIGTQTRGSTRLVQIVGRTDGPLGIALTVLDACKMLAHTPPGLTWALSSRSSRHGVKATVTSLPTLATYSIRAAPTSTGGTVPSQTSTVWRTILVGTTANTTQHYLKLASKTKWWGEVRGKSVV